MPNNNKLEKLCNDIFALSPNIRFAGVVNRMGTLVAGGMRQSIKSMEGKEDSSTLYLESALRSEMRKDFDKDFGKTIYSFSDREKIKVASFPLHNDNLLRVSIEKQEQSHEKIIQSILKIINDLISQDSSWTIGELTLFHILPDLIIQQQQQNPDNNVLSSLRNIEDRQYPNVSDVAKAAGLVY